MTNLTWQQFLELPGEHEHAVLGLHTVDVAASEQLRSPRLDGFAVEVGALVRR
jgi:hypothetical protein